MDKILTAEQIVRDLAAYSNKYPPGKWYSEGHESHGISKEIEQRAKDWVDAAQEAASTQSAGVRPEILYDMAFTDGNKRHCMKGSTLYEEQRKKAISLASLPSGSKGEVEQKEESITTRISYSCVDGHPYATVFLGQEPLGSIPFPMDQAKTYLAQHHTNQPSPDQ